MYDDLDLYDDYDYMYEDEDDLYDDLDDGPTLWDDYLASDQFWDEVRADALTVEKLPTETYKCRRSGKAHKMGECAREFFPGVRKSFKRHMSRKVRRDARLVIQEQLNAA